MANNYARYRIAAPEGFAWREWDDDVVVFCHGTGNTHLLGPLGGYVLEALQQADRPLAAREVDREIAVDWADASEAERAAQIELVLLQLTQIGLAETTPC